MKFFPSRSAVLHLRFPFSFFLLPVYVFALSQVPFVHTINAWMVFIAWHFFVYPASNGYNSYFDRDEGSIALVEHPPAVDKSLYYSSLVLEAAGILLAMLVSIEFMVAAITYGLLSKLYSHPAVRLKKYPVYSFLVVFIFQGAFVYWFSYAAISRLSVFDGFNLNFFLAGMVCSCLIGASYPLTQVYQHEEDSKRGDKTLSLLLGVRGSFYFSAVLFLAVIILMYFYWKNIGQPANFWIFLFFTVPVFGVFIHWFLQVLGDEKAANFRNMTRMTIVSGLVLLSYFCVIYLTG